MFCRECGAKISDDSSFCFRCGSSTALPAGSPVAENAKNKGESPNTGAEKHNENDDNGSFDGINAYNQKIQARQKKKRILLFIGVGVLLLAIIAAISFHILSNKDNDTVSTQTGAEEPHNTTGNTPANATNESLATIQNKTIYYLQFDGADQLIKSMDINGGSEVTECTLDSYASGLNVIGDNMYFVTYDLDENADVTGSYVNCLPIGYSSPTKLYSTLGEIENFFVSENKIYFIEAYADNDDKLIAMDMDGSNTTCLLSKETIYNFSLSDSYIYYQVDLYTLNRCDLSGNQTEEIYSASNNIGCTSFCIADSKLYMATFAVDEATIRVMDLDGSNDTLIYTAGKWKYIGELNVANGVVYYIESSLSNDYQDFTDSTLSCLDLDGTNRKEIMTSQYIISQVNLCDQWLFYHNPDQANTVKIKTSTI